MCNLAGTIENIEITMEKQYDIFISYSRKDFDEVNAFVEMLKLRIPTLDIWFDLDGIESGDEFRDKIISAIKRSKYVLFALSSNSDKSEWTRKELGFAKGKGIKIVPVLLRGAHLQEMDWFLFEFSGVDCIDIVDQKQIDKLIKNLAKWTNKELIQNKKDSLSLNDKQIKSITVVESVHTKAHKKSWLWILLGIAFLIAAVTFGTYRVKKVVDAREKYEIYVQDSIESIRKEKLRLDSIKQDSIKRAFQLEAEKIAQERKQLEDEREQARQLKETERLKEQQRLADEQKKDDSETQSIRKHNGHEYVDLGLSVMWATCNIGASKPEEYGKRFAWGETAPKSAYDWSTYKYCNGSYNSFTKYCIHSEDGNNGFTDHKTTLELSDDAAYTNWGGNWRMPTYIEWYDLLKECTWELKNQNGVKGYYITARNGNSIFLPISNMMVALRIRGSKYWLSSLDVTDSHQAYCSLLTSFYNTHSISREMRDSQGFVRPVFVNKPMVAQIREEMILSETNDTNIINYLNAKHEIDNIDIDARLRRLKAEKELYDQLMSEEAKNTVPTFGLR